MQVVVEGGSEVSSPTAPYLFSSPVAPPPVESQRSEELALLPSTIDVDVWVEDGTWTAHSPLLGVTAIGESEVDVYAEFAEQLSEFWDILNERFETLSQEMRNLLDLRGQAFRFVKR